MTHPPKLRYFTVLNFFILYLFLTQFHVFSASLTRRNDLRPQLDMVVIRHGDRTPITKFPNDNTFWNCSAVPAELSQSPIQLSQPGAAASIRYSKRFVRGILNGSCMMGQLTSKGMLQHIELGKRYGHRLASSLDCNALHIETTDRPRTIQSMESFMTGFLSQAADCASLKSVLSVDTVENSIHDMFTNFNACPLLSRMQKEMEKDDAWVKEHAKVSDLYSRYKKVFDIPQRTNPQWYEFADVLTCRISHGVPLPPGITNRDVEDTFRTYVWEYEYGNQNQKYLSLSIGSFLHRLVERIENVNPRANDTRVPFELYSGHDTTLAPLLGTLGIELTLNTWPDYAANLHFHVSTDGSNRFVTVEYMEKLFQLKGCSAVDCPWNEFRDIVDKYILPYDEWIKQCNDL